MTTPTLTEQKIIKMFKGIIKKRTVEYVLVHADIVSKESLRVHFRNLRAKNLIDLRIKWGTVSLNVK